MGLSIMIAGLVLFLGIHTLTTMRSARARVIARLGEGGYKILYTIVSIVGIALIAWGFSLYRQFEWINIWFPPAWTRHLALGLMLPAVILFVASYIRGRIFTALKHPMLAAVKLWAVLHLIANGDLGSIVLFGSVLAWAVYDRISLKHRSDPGAPPIPVGGVTNDLIAVGVGVVVYVAIVFAFHPLIIGVSLVGAT
ncbi:MAG: NnrU family protein [Afipia sp.]|nr:NnrU family protein [Afipia sp.]